VKVVLATNFLLVGRLVYGEDSCYLLLLDLGLEKC
jgi:hypothetical protein